jgi:hypothetical protein
MKKSAVFSLILMSGLLFPATSTAQSVPANRLEDRQITCIPPAGTTALEEASQKLLVQTLRQRLHEELKTAVDTLCMNSGSSPHASERSIFQSPHGNRGLVREASFPQSQIYVIDTAIVRSLTDTTRHLYSFNAHAKRISDLTQKLIGDLWVDTLRYTNTYDASDNTLSNLYEYWSNGQWMNNSSETFTYDANGNVLSDLSQLWSNDQWLNALRFTYTYDVNGKRLSYLYEIGSNG